MVSDAFLRLLSAGGGGRGAWWDYCSSYSGKCSAEGRREPGRRRRRSAEAGDGGWMRPEDGDAMAPKKRVMEVIDRMARAKQAMIHVAGKGDLLTILHIIGGGGDAGEAPQLAMDLGTLC